MTPRRVFYLNSGYAGVNDQEVVNMLIDNWAVEFYQTIIFPTGETVDYYVFRHDDRAGTHPPTDDRRK